MDNHTEVSYEFLEEEFCFSERQIRDLQIENESDMRVHDLYQALSVVSPANRKVFGLWIAAYRTKIGKEVGRKLKEEVIDLDWFVWNESAINIKLAYYAQSSRVTFTYSSAALR